MSNELTPQQSFEEKIKDRMRDDIGELIPDDVLAQLVQKAIEDHFFKPVRDGQYSTKPSWFEREVSERINARVTKTLDAYFKENSEVIAQLVVKQLADNMPGFAVAFLGNVFSGVQFNIVDSLSQTMRNTLQQNFPNQTF